MDMKRDRYHASADGSDAGTAVRQTAQRERPAADSVTALTA